MVVLGRGGERWMGGWRGGWSKKVGMNGVGGVSNIFLWIKLFLGL